MLATWFQSVQFQYFNILIRFQYFGNILVHSTVLSMVCWKTLIWQFAFMLTILCFLACINEWITSTHMQLSDVWFHRHSFWWVWRRTRSCTNTHDMERKWVHVTVYSDYYTVEIPYKNIIYMCLQQTGPIREIRGPRANFYSGGGGGFFPDI
jgi:hypothetical protein